MDKGRLENQNYGLFVSRVFFRQFFYPGWSFEVLF